MHDTHVKRFFDVARSVANGDAAAASADLRVLLDDVARAEDPRSVGLYVFGAALARRLSGTTADEANLYLNQFDVPQIHLFNLLGTTVPFVGLATKLANDAIARACEGEAHPTVIDVGIGTGRQMCALLASWAEAKKLPRAITIVGIEPSDWSLDLARKNVEATARDLGANVTFHPFLGTAESLTRGDWRRLREVCVGRPVINASFALHHIADVGGADVRNDVLLRLRSLDPRALVLSEPNVDHLDPRFYERFENCFRHFGAVFATIDRLPIEQRDRNALKVCFFGREIVDILGNAEGQRSERHESTRSWLARLDAAGWSVRFDGTLPEAGSDAVRLAVRDGYASIDSLEEPVVSVLCAVPVGSRADADAALARAPATRTEPTRGDALDVDVYLAALVAVAMADRVLHRSERDFIETQARVLGVHGDALRARDLDDVLATASALSLRTREAIVRDLVFLAKIDGTYSGDERDAIASIAARLGLRDQLPAIESNAAAPADVNGAPSWFTEYWFLGQKSGSNE